MAAFNYVRTDFKYDELGRFSSYWHQVHEALSPQPETLLEVGPGTYLFHDYLTRRGVSATILDIVPPEQPGVVGTVTHLPFRDNSFDVAVAFEVLEHIPFDQFPIGLVELCRVARRRVVVSVPDNRYYVRLLANGLSRAGAKSHGREARLLVSFPRLLHRRLPPREAKLGASHLWEIGRHGFPLNRVLSSTPDGIRLVCHQRLWHYPFHHIFIFEKEGG